MHHVHPTLFYPCLLLCIAWFLQASNINEEIALKSKMRKILASKKGCNTQEHARIEKNWVHMMCGQSEQKGQRGRIFPEK